MTVKTRWTLSVKTLVKAASCVKLRRKSEILHLVRNGTHRVLVNASSPGGTCVIDQDMKHFFLLREFLDESLHLGDFLQICRNRETLARPELIQFVGSIFAVLD